MAYSRNRRRQCIIDRYSNSKIAPKPKTQNPKTKISLVRGDHVQQLNICFQYFNLVLIFPRNRRRRCAATEYFDFLNILEYIDLILIFSRNRRGRCAATVRSWWRGIPWDHGAGRLFLLIYSYIHIFLIFIYSWYSRDHGASGLFCAHIFILNIFEIMALVGFLLIYSFLILQSLPLNFLSLNAIFRWGWPANLCMCGDYKRRCRNGFKIRVSFPFFKIRVSFPFFSKSGWVFLSFQNLCEFSFLFKIRVSFPFIFKIQVSFPFFSESL